ncbi:ATP synthase subunit delta [Nocardioides sp. Root1257]|uniref:F0F1 ATP synthase subunit delta n=1 Tax=unclassified Nocardioides TaxID=2615069 RepID=UPI0006FB1775|nr:MULTISPECIES: F0F1 ATP synthase subunit delta [unclassified Nocardioides]KQW48358.1 ATP synthase subunit delta [Nocardioides sp. Root1257]KRC47532.1 ATP synthase subunit delta [Nocardioides sp. Root224]
MDLRGASADSLRELAAELGEALRPGEHAERVSRELYNVSSLLRSEPALRRFATDASLPADAKKGLVQQVFAGKLDDATLALVTSAAGRRWTSARDLANAVERLSEIAAVTSVGTDASTLVDELFALGQMLVANPDLRDGLANPARSTEDKAALLDSLLGGKVLPATLALATQALRGTYGTLTGALATYRQVAAEASGEAVATVRVVKSLSDADRERLAAALSQQYGKQVHLNEIVEPGVLGGMRVEIGDDVIDGTVSSRLDDARRKLVG